MNVPGRGWDEEWAAWAGVTVGVHVRSGTVLAASVHPGQDRVVLDVTGLNSVNVNLFLRRADLVRLIGTASTALADLDAAPAHAIPADIGDTGETGETGETTGGDTASAA